MNWLKRNFPIVVIAALFAWGYTAAAWGVMHPPESYPRSHGAPLDPRVDFSFYGGRSECKGKICMPSALKECITATGDCRVVEHPIDHPLMVTTCYDPIAGHEIFYTEASRFCLR